MATETERKALVLEHIAKGLGTARAWNGAGELEWIADLIGKVMPNPGDVMNNDHYESLDLKPIGNASITEKDLPTQDMTQGSENNFRVEVDPERMTAWVMIDGVSACVFVPDGEDKADMVVTLEPLTTEPRRVRVAMLDDSETMWDGVVQGE